MKKLVLLGGVLLISALGFAQDFATQNGVLFLDNKEIAIVTEKNKVYTFSDLSGYEKLKVKQLTFKCKNNTNIMYYEVSLPNDSISIAIENESNKTGLTAEKKLFTDFYAGKYNLLTNTGINQNAIDAIFNDNHAEIANLLDERSGNQEEAKQAEKFFKDKKFKFDTKGQFGRDEKDYFVIYGAVKRVKVLGSVYKYEVYDCRGKLVGTWNNDGKNNLELTNSKKLHIGQNHCLTTQSLASDDGAMMMIGYALLNSDLGLKHNINERL